MSLETVKSLALIAVGAVALCALADVAELRDEVAEFKLSADAAAYEQREYIDEADQALLAQQFRMLQIMDVLIDRVNEGELRYD